MPGQLSLLTLFFPALACFGAGTFPLTCPLMLPSPGTALSSLWKVGCQLSTHHPAEALCRNPLGTDTHVTASRRAVHSSAAQPPLCPRGWEQVEMDTGLWRMCRGLPTWSCFPQMTCVGALILLMLSWRECLDFSSTISKNTSGSREESVLQGNVLPSLLKGGPVGQSCQYPLTGKPMQT